MLHLHSLMASHSLLNVSHSDLQLINEFFDDNHLPEIPFFAFECMDIAFKLSLVASVS